MHGNERDATKCLNEQETDARHPAPFPWAMRGTVGHYFDDWIRTSVKPRPHARTARDYEEAVKLYDKLSVGTRFLKMLDAPTVREMYVEMRERGLSLRTIRKAHVRPQRHGCDRPAWTRRKRVLPHPVRRLGGRRARLARKRAAELAKLADQLEGPK